MTAERGFTLIEALIGFAILAVTLVAFYEAMGTSFRTFARAAEVEEAVLVAQSELDRIVATRRVPAEQRGTTGRYAWQLDVLATARGTTGLMRLQPLKLTVTWPSAGRGVVLERSMLVPVGQP